IPGTRLRPQMALKQLARPRPIFIVDDVVPVEDAARPVTAEFHRYPLGDAGAHHIPHSCASKVVHDDATQSRLLARCLPCLPKVADRLTVILEDVWADRSPVFVRALNNLQQLAAHREWPSVFVFADLGSQTKLATWHIDVAPFESTHLANAPARQVEESHGVL